MVSVRGSIRPRRRVVHDTARRASGPRRRSGRAARRCASPAPPARPCLDVEAAATAATSPTTPTSTGRLTPSARRVEVDLGDDGAGRDQPAVPGGPHVQRAAPGDHEVGPADQLGGERGGEAAGHVEVPRVAGEQSLRRRRHGEQRAAPVGERGQRRPGGRRAPGRAAAGDEHRSPCGAQRPGEPRDVGRVDLGRWTGRRGAATSGPAASSGPACAPARPAAGPSTHRPARPPRPPGTPPPTSGDRVLAPVPGGTRRPPPRPAPAGR